MQKDSPNFFAITTKHGLGCTITGHCFEELRNGDNEDTKLDQDKMYSWRNEPHDMIRHSMARLDNKV